MNEKMSYVDAICLLRRLHDVREGAGIEDPEGEINSILDRLPKILDGLDPSLLPFNRKNEADDENDLMTLVARAAWGAGWQSCIAFNQRNERDLYGGDPIAMVVQGVLAKARPASPLTPEREWEIEKGGSAVRVAMLFELLAALRYERGFAGRMSDQERAEWRKRQERLEVERNKAEEERDAMREKLAESIREAFDAGAAWWPYRNSSSPPPHKEDVVRRLTKETP